MNPTTQSNPSLQPNQQLHQLQHHQQQALFPPPLPPAPPLHQQQPPQLLQPHRPSTSCDRHPQEQFTGFCPSCLCERLAVLDPNGSAASSSSSGPRRSTSSSTAAAALRAIFRPSASGSNRGNRPPPTSSTSSSFFPELRRTKSFSASKNNEGFFSGAFEPQRRSCDVRVRSTLFSLFNQDDERKIPKKEPSGEVETRNLASSSTIVQAPVTLEEESESESESASVLEEEIQEQEEENDQNEDEIRVLEGPTNAVVPNIVTEERVAVTEIVEEEPELQPEPEIVVVPEEELLKPMKEHIDLDSNAKKSSGRDFKGSFWSAASVFSKKLQKWRQKQKLKKQRCRNGALGSGTTLLPVEKPIGRQFRETQSEIADYGFGRRSCDTDPRFSLDIGRMSFEAGRVSLDDPRYSFDEPRASWDGYLIGRTFPPPRMPSMLSVVEDAPVHQVLRTDTQIPVEEPVNVMMNAIIENADQAKVPGGTLQTREYYSDSSSRRRKSLDRSSSIRKTAAAVVAEMDELKPVSGAIPVANAKVTPAVGIGGVGGGVGIGIGISGGVDLSHHGPKAVFPDRDLRDRDSNSNSLRDDHSETFELGSRDAAGINGERKGAKKSFRWSKAWNIWGLINRRGGGGNKDDDEENRYGRGNGGNGVERSFSPYPNVYVIQSTFQIRGMHTLIRDKDISKHDFVFYSDRLIRLVVEHGLGHLPFTEKQVVTPTGSVYTGVDFCKKLCGVSIVRSGESMENALRACCKGIKIGKILIHRDGDDGQQLIYEKLPKDISERHVLLLDPVLATGNSANQAIELLIQKGVPESHIIFLNLISAPEGIHCVCKRFPSLKIVTSEIDAALNDEFRVIPGLGEFGDRYFGTDD